MLSVKEYLKPRTLREAWDMANEAKSLYVSGGLMVAQLKNVNLERLIDLKSLGLNDIVEEDGYVKIGANVKLSSFMNEEKLSKLYGGFFPKFMKDVGSTQIRNMATVGGSIAFRLGWSDVITAMMILKAEVEIFDGNLKRIPVDEYLSMKRGKEIVTSVFLPISHRKIAFEKFSKSTFDIAVLNVGVSFELEDDKVRNAVVSVGSRPMRSTRAKEVEEFLEFKDLSALEEAAEMLTKTIKVGTDIRASADYRKVLMVSLFKKCVRRIGNESHV